MPKSKRRQSAPRRRQTRAELVAQRGLADLVDGLDDVLRAVPATYDADSIADAVEHHYRCAEVVRFLRERRVVDALARLAGGSMIVIPDGPEELEAAAREAGTQAAADLAEGELVSGTPTRDPQYRATSNDPLTVPAAPATEPPEVTVRWSEPMVWMATWRTGINFHGFDLSRDQTTMCGRSTRAAHSIELRRAAALRHGAIACPRCWPVQPPTLPTRAPGASTDGSGRTLAEALPHPLDVTGLTVFDRSVYAERVDPDRPFNTIRHAVEVHPDALHVGGPHGRVACPGCGNSRGLTANGRIVNHGPRAKRCPASMAYVVTSEDSPLNGREAAA